MGGSLKVDSCSYNNHFYFADIIKLEPVTTDWIKGSNGRIIIKLSGVDEIIHNQNMRYL